MNNICGVELMIKQETLEFENLSLKKELADLDAMIKKLQAENMQLMGVKKGYEFLEANKAF